MTCITQLTECNLLAMLLALATALAIAVLYDELRRRRR